MNQHEFNTLYFFIEDYMLAPPGSRCAAIEKWIEQLKGLLDDYDENWKVNIEKAIKAKAAEDNGL